MGADGSDPRALPPGPESQFSPEYPAFSADGTQIVFDRGDELDAMKTDGTAFRYLFQGGDLDEMPALSPDGINVSFAMVVRQGFPQIVVAPFSTSTDSYDITTVTPVWAGAASRPAWPA
jgi:Tol biopolymer transport system component